MKEIIRDKIENLPPKTKRLGMLVAAGIVIILIVSLFSTDTKERKPKSQQDAIRSVLTDRDTRSLSLDSVGGKLELLSRQLEEVSRAQSRLEADVKATKKSANKVENFGRVIDRLENEIKNNDDRMTKIIDDVESNVMSKLEDKEGHYGSGSDITPPPADTKDGVWNSGDDAEYQDSRDYFATPKSVGQMAPNPSGSDSDSEETARPAMKINSHVETTAVDEAEGSSERESYYIPAGSIISGVLINGMDAPTGQGARREPFPATVRVKGEAILPNRFRADIQECFITIAGYGDLSSERAYLRSETLSCIRDDGGVIETSLAGYAVGEDGKAGVRGRLVSKQGPIIAKSLMAGFMNGASKMFDVNPVPVISTSPTGEQQYNKVLSGSAVQGAAVAGVSSSLERIADFYMDMADGMFPVIEIDAVRNIDIIMTKGAALKVVGNTTSSGNNEGNQ